MPYWFIPLNHTLKKKLSGFSDSTEHIYFWPLIWEWRWHHNTLALFGILLYTLFQLLSFFNLRRQHCLYQATNFSSFFLFCFVSPFPFFLMSISGNLMILLNMWVIFDCCVKTDYECLVFLIRLFHLFVMSPQFAWMHELTNYFLIIFTMWYTFLFWFLFCEIGMVLLITSEMSRAHIVLVAATNSTLWHS